MSPLGPPFSLLFKVCFKTYLSLSPLHLNLYFYEKNFLIYLPCIGKSRTFAPAFQETESRLKLTCCKCVLIALTDNQNNLLFIWSLILKFVIFAVRFAIKGVYSGAFPFRQESQRTDRENIFWKKTSKNIWCFKINLLPLHPLLKRSAIETKRSLKNW